MDNHHADFELLSPDLVIDAVEAAMDLDLSGYTQPMPSYINRVFELKSEDGDYYIAKFYRPGRWSNSAILEEHRFVIDCWKADIPVARPLPMKGLADSEDDAPTLGSVEGIPFAVFRRRGGRLWEAGCDDDWHRLGSLLGRIHNAGSARRARRRITISAEESLQNDIELILSSDWVTPELVPELKARFDIISEVSLRLFSGFGREDYIRVHGDFHSGNILDRPGEGLLVMDFDDMANALPVQDVWLLLPDHVPESGREIACLLEGYREFRSFNTDWLELVEPLRAMRMIYFLAWCGKQKNDFRFRHHFPDWGSKAFWVKEIQDLSDQTDQIKRALAGERSCF